MSSSRSKMSDSRSCSISAVGSAVGVVDVDLGDTVVIGRLMRHSGSERCPSASSVQPVQSRLHRQAMRLQRFRRSEADGSGLWHGLRGHARQRHAFMKVKTDRPDEKRPSRRSAAWSWSGRQRIADAPRASTREEDRPGVGDLSTGSGSATAGRCSGDAVLTASTSSRSRTVTMAPRSPRWTGDVGTFEGFSGRHGVGHGLTEGGVGGDQDAARFRRVRLRQQIDGDPVRVVVGVCDHQDFEGPAIMSMPTRPKTRRFAAATKRAGPVILSTARWCRCRRPWRRSPARRRCGKFQSRRTSVPPAGPSD